jgi:hypothetical protein
MLPLCILSTYLGTCEFGNNVLSADLQEQRYVSRSITEGPGAKIVHHPANLSETSSTCWIVDYGVIWAYHVEPSLGKNWIRVMMYFQWKEGIPWKDTIFGSFGYERPYALRHSLISACIKAMILRLILSV